jgi:arabinosaccharide transport system substrate-binding protein
MTMSFNLGKPILVMVVISLISGVFILRRPPAPRADLDVWVFADSHYRTFADIVPMFEKRHDVTVNLSVMNGKSMAVRLSSLFMAVPDSTLIPDLVEMEIGLVGRFFRPPVPDIGFLPIERRLKESGHWEQLVHSRLAPWSKDGVVFGAPHDVHPVGITYREDLFRVAGIDLAEAKTWREFHSLCVQFERYWTQRGYRYRHALELPASSSEYLQVMLLQRGINLIDDRGNVRMDDPKAAETLAFYAQLVAGPRRITGVTNPGNAAFARDVAEGNLCAFITPDWRVTYIKNFGGPAVAGRMRMMPLPVFEAGDTPTSTLGGTMMGITRASRKQDMAWKLLEFLYFSDEGLAARRRHSDILPPIRKMWQDPYYHAPDPFFGGQRIHELLTDLAGKIPRRYVTPATPIATMALNDALVRAVDHVDEHGSVGLESACQEWLSAAARKLEARMKQWRFEE